MVVDRNSPYLPVAIMTTTLEKHLRVSGVRRGTTDEIAALAAPWAQQVSLSRWLTLRPACYAVSMTRRRRSGSRSSCLPTLPELLATGVSFRDLRTLEVADLLGRKQVDIDWPIAGYLSNRRVLVTGAGGSIGSELCRQVARYGPGELIMLDRDESALHATQLSIDGRALLDTRNVVLADIRDATPCGALHRAPPRHRLPRRRPQAPAAAGAVPRRGVKTNVLGTLNVLDAAQSAGVGVFVNISTDKAADPTCVLGYSKRIAERLTAAAAHGPRGATCRCASATCSAAAARC